MASADASLHLQRSADGSSHMNRELHQLKTDDLFTDFSITHGSRIIKCHRVILAANSPMMKTMISTDMKEASTQQAKLESVPYRILEELIDYMYSGQITIPSNSLLETINACNFLQMEELKDQCMQEIPAILKPSNAISCYKLAVNMNVQNIQEQCSEIMCKSFKLVAQEEEFLGLEIVELIDYFTNAKAKEVSADDVLDGAMSWINHNAKNRAESMKDLLNHVALEDCTPQCLDKQFTANTQLLESNFVAFKLFTKAFQSMALGQENMKKGKEHKRKHRLATIGGRNYSNQLNKICWCLDPSNQLREFTQIPKDKCFLWNSACKVDDGFVVTGGEGSKVCIMFRADQLSCCSFCGVPLSWSKLQELLVTRYRHGSVCVRGMLFVMGGIVAHNASNSVDYLEIGGTEGWKKTTPLPVAIGRPKVVSMDDDMFVLDAAKRQLYHMDVESKSWSSRSPMPGYGECEGVSMAASKQALYVAGGENRNHFAWYTPSTDTWTTGSLHRNKHSYGALVCMEETLYLLGGYTSDTVEEYDIKEGTWAVSRYKIPQPFGQPFGWLHGVVVELPE